MTYHININKTNIKEFLQIAGSLKRLGVIESIESNKNLVREGEPINEDVLLDILAFSKQEIEDGNSFSMEEIKNQIEDWKKER